MIKISRFTKTRIKHLHRLNNFNTLDKLNILTVT